MPRSSRCTGAFYLHRRRFYAVTLVSLLILAAFPLFAQTVMDAAYLALAGKVLSNAVDILEGQFPDPSSPNKCRPISYSMIGPLVNSSTAGCYFERCLSLKLIYVRRRDTELLRDLFD